VGPRRRGREDREDGRELEIREWEEREREMALI
jgi:hypothetical protein